MKSKLSCCGCGKSCKEQSDMENRLDTAKATVSSYMDIEPVGGLHKDSRNTNEWHNSGKIPNHLGKTVSVN